MEFIKKTIKKLRPFDYLIIAIIVITLVVGLLTFIGKRATSSKQIEATMNIELEIYLRGVTATGNEPVFKKGEETFITIRNVPYTKLKINEVKFDKRKTIVPSNNSKNYAIVDDDTAPFTYDYLVRVEDNAKITKDGDAVVGGNKVKIGIPITLEGAKYKLNGVITNVIANPIPNDNHEDLDRQTKLNQDVH